MEWFVTNWFWVLIGIAFVGMHLFGHGGHGGHGGGSRPRPAGEGKTGDTPEPGVTRSSGGHH